VPQAPAARADDRLLERFFLAGGCRGRPPGARSRLTD
jgi:hypothetical protein